MTGTELAVPLNPGDLVESPHRTYTITRHIQTGSLSDVYLADSPNGPVAVKVAHGDGDQVSTEALNLARLHSEGDPKLIPFLPEMYDAFIWQDTWVNVFEYLDGWYTLTEVHARFPELDPKHVAWMFRRLLAVAGFVSRLGLVHGALEPANVLIHPEMHGLKVIDWTQTYDEDERSATCNVMQSVECAIYLLGGDPTNWTLPASCPREFRAFINGSRTFTDPWVLLENFDKLLERMWGRRRFHPFDMT